MVQTLQLILEIPPIAVQLVVDVLVVQLQGPQVQFCRCVVAATSSNCWFRGVDFLGPCTQVQGREPCPQGHSSHN